MTEQQKRGALEYIKNQLKYGYIDLDMYDKYELELVKEAINLWETIDEWNSIGLPSTLMTSEELKRILNKV